VHQRTHGPNTHTPRPHPPGFRYSIQTQGFLSLYRGLAPTLIAAFPKAGIRFGSNAYFKNQLKDENGKLTPGACVPLPVCA
jgi:hypothetical protein